MNKTKIEANAAISFVPIFKFEKYFFIALILSFLHWKTAVHDP